MKTGDIKNLAIVVGIGFATFAVARLFDKATGALTTLGEAIGSGLYDFFHPNEMGETKFFHVTFPDGTRHSIPSSWVDPSGIFVNRTDPNNLLYKGDGKTYRIVKRVGTGGTVLAAFPA